MGGKETLSAKAVGLLSRRNGSEAGIVSGPEP